MRARLGRSGAASFTAICDPEMVEHLGRVVQWAGGAIVRRRQTGEGTLLEIRKPPPGER